MLPMSEFETEVSFDVVHYSSSDSMQCWEPANWYNVVIIPQDEVVHWKLELLL